MLKLLLVGVDHRIQWIPQPQQLGVEWRRDLEDFAAYLRDQALQAGVDLVAEELSEESLRESDARDSVARTVAASLQIGHAFWDPDFSARRKLSIDAGDEREAYWLARLQESTASVILFVCGDNHVDSFRARTQAAGHEVEVVSRNWGEGWQLKA